MSLRPPYAPWRDLRDIQRWCDQQRTQELVYALVQATPYTVGDEDVVLVDDDTVGGAVTVNLPPAANNDGRCRIVKKLGTGGNVTIDGNASEEIDGATTNVLSSQFDAIRILSDGTGWHIIG